MDVGAEGSSTTGLMLEQLRVQVIHWTALVERRAHVERVLEETGLARQAEVRWVTEWDQEAVRAEGAYEAGRWGDPARIRAGSVSLILKHVAAWRRVAEAAESDPAGWHLVLEDDVLVPRAATFWADFGQVVAELPEGGWDLLFIGLGCDLHVPWWRRRRGRRVHWRGWRRGWLWGGGGCSRCTEAYLIHPEFARRLVKSRWVEPPFDRPIDWLLNAAGAALRARSFWVEPPLVTQGAFQSWEKDARFG